MSSPSELVLIAAMARNRVIGKDNRLLWHLPEDMRHFKELTAGHTVVMGRKTWESLPEKFRPLPERRNIVISRNAAFAAPGAEVVTSLPAALDQAAGMTPIFIIGGAQIYAQALPLAQRIELTVLDTDYEGDALFPTLGSEWEETAREPRTAADGSAFAFLTFRRR